MPYNRPTSQKANFKTSEKHDFFGSSHRSQAIYILYATRAEQLDCQKEPCLLTPILRATAPVSLSWGRKYVFGECALVLNAIKFFIILAVLRRRCNELVEPISASLRHYATQLLLKKCCSDVEPLPTLCPI